MIRSNHSQMCKKNSCSVKLQGGPLDDNPRKIPVENSWTIILQKNSKSLLLNIKTKATQDTVQFFTEAVVRRCSAKKVFLKISHNSQETTCARASFLIKLQTWGCEFCEIPKNTCSYRITPVAASVVRRNIKHKKMKTRE